MAWNCIEFTNMYTPYRRQTLLAFALAYHGSLTVFLDCSICSWVCSSSLLPAWILVALASDLLLTWILVFAHAALWFLVVFSDKNFPT